MKVYRVRIADISGDGKNLGTYSSPEKAEKAKARWERRQVMVDSTSFLGGVYFPETCESIYNKIPYEAKIHIECTNHAQNLLPDYLTWNCHDECFIIEEVVK